MKNILYTTVLVSNLLLGAGGVSAMEQNISASSNAKISQSIDGFDAVEEGELDKVEASRRDWLFAKYSNSTFKKLLHDIKLEDAIYEYRHSGKDDKMTFVLFCAHIAKINFVPQESGEGEDVKIEKKKTLPELKHKFKVDLHGLTKRGIEQVVFRLCANANPYADYDIDFEIRHNDNIGFKNKVKEYIEKALDSIGYSSLLKCEMEGEVPTKIVLHIPKKRDF